MKKLLWCLITAGIGLVLFAKGSQDLDNTEWRSFVISGEAQKTDSLKLLQVKNYYTVLTVKTVPDISAIRYRVRGIPDRFITVNENGDSFTITETDMFHLNKRSRKRIDAEMEILIPQGLKIGAINIETVIGNAVLENLASLHLTVHSRVNNLKLNNTECEVFKLKGGVGHVAVKKIRCLGEAEITTSVGDVNIEDLSCNALSLKTGVGNVSAEKITCTGADITTSIGNLEVTKFDCNELILKTGIGHTILKEAYTEKKSSVTCSTGKINFSNCTLKNLTFAGGTGSCVFKGVLKGECFIESSIGRCTFTIAAPQNDYKISLQNATSGASNISVKGFDFKNFTLGNENAENILHLKSGLGKIKIDFSE